MSGHHAGFSLIELLVVIAIIGILTALVLGGALVARARAHDVRVKTSIRQLRVMAESYRNDHGDAYTGWAACALDPTPATCGENELALDVSALTAEIDAATQQTDATTAADSATQFCVAAPLSGLTGSFVCADASGDVSQGAAALSPCREQSVCRFEP